MYVSQRDDDPSVPFWPVTRSSPGSTLIAGHSGASDGAWMIINPSSLAAASNGSIRLFSFSNSDASAVSFQTSTITNAVVTALQQSKAANRFVVQVAGHKQSQHSTKDKRERGWRKMVKGKMVKGRRGGEKGVLERRYSLVYPSVVKLGLKRGRILSKDVSLHWEVHVGGV